MTEEGRYSEAEQLIRSAIDVEQTIGVAVDSPDRVQRLGQLGAVLVAQGKMQAARAVYDQIDSAIAQWPVERREIYQDSESRIAALYAAGQFDQGIAAAQELVKRLSARAATGAFDTASAQGLLAIGYARAGRDAEAMAEFKLSIPALTAAEHEAAATDDPTLVAARGARVRRAVEAYIGLLAKGGAGPEVAAETFALADLVRGHVVDRSLADFERPPRRQRPGAGRASAQRAGPLQTGQRRTRRARQPAVATR